MTATLYDSLGFLIWIVFLYLPVFWWGGCYIWQAMRTSKYGTLDSKVSFVRPQNTQEAFTQSLPSSQGKKVA